MTEFLQKIVGEKYQITTLWRENCNLVSMKNFEMEWYIEVPLQFQVDKWVMEKISAILSP